MRQITRQINQASIKSTAATSSNSNNNGNRKNQSTSKNYKMGDPILFAPNSNASTSKGVGFSPDNRTQLSSTGFLFGETSIKFGGVELNHEPSVQIKAENSPQATRGNSSPHYSPSFEESWGTSHRFIPPSPSPSIQSDTSTARFSFTRSYNDIRNASPSPSPGRNRSLLNRSISRNDEMSMSNQKVKVETADTWAAVGRLDFGVQVGTPSVREQIVKKGKITLSQNDVAGLLEGIDFEEEFDMEEDGESDYYSAIGSPLILPLKTKIITKRVPLLDLYSSIKDDIFSPRLVPSSTSFLQKDPHSKSSTPFFSSPTRSSTSQIPRHFPSHLVPPISTRLSNRPFSSSPPSNASQTFIIKDEEDTKLLIIATERKTIDRSKVIEIDDSKSDSDISIQFLPKGKGKGNQFIELSEDDDEVIILPSTRPKVNTTFSKGSTSIHTSAISSASLPNSDSIPAPPPKPIRAGFFIKPASLQASSSAAPITSSSILDPILPPKPRAKYRTRPDPVAVSTSTKKVSKSQLRNDKDQLMRNKYIRDFDWRGDSLSTSSAKRPELIYTKDEKEVERVLGLLKGPMGFDLEWKPTLRRGAKENKTALVQICDQKIILLVHIAKMASFPKCLKTFIEDQTKIKLGVQVGGDGLKLKRDFNLVPAGLLELNNVGRTLDPTRWTDRTTRGLIGLQKLCGMYLDRYLPKDSSVRCGDWNQTLEKDQMHYAANDVYSSLQIFLYLQSMAPTMDLFSLASSNSSTASQFHPVLKVPVQALSSPLQAQYNPADPSLITEAGQNKLLTNLTPRQREAYILFFIQNLSLKEVAIKMSLSRSILPASVMWYLLASLSGSKNGVDVKQEEGSNGSERLKFDKEKLERALEEVSASKSGTYKSMVLDQKTWLAKEGIIH